MRLSFLLLVVGLTTLFPAIGQRPHMLRPFQMGKRGIPYGNYSGITPLGNEQYALVDDKKERCGFHLIKIVQDSMSGKVTDLLYEGFKGEGPALHPDAEDLVYVPSRHSIFMTSEARQTIEEYTCQGQATDYGLDIPPCFSSDSIQRNCGWEALAYDSCNKTFYTITECALPADGVRTDLRQPLRLIRFNELLKPEQEWGYLMEAPRLKSKARYYAHGVPALLYEDNGNIIVMERELRVPSSYIGAKTIIRLFRIHVDDSSILTTTLPLNSAPFDLFLKKEEIASFTTRLNITRRNFANYEGMCFGITLKNGRRTLLLVNDSQGGMGNHLVRLKDYIKVIVL